MRKFGYDQVGRLPARRLFDFCVRQPPKHRGELMPNGTYSGSYTTGIYLDSTYPVATIAAAARVNVASGDGVDGGATAYTLTNAGSIEAATGYGIYLQAGGTIDNLAGALVSGFNGVGLAAAGLVENTGTIEAQSTDGTGVVIVDAGTVHNAGTISARGRYAEGIYGSDGDLVTNLAGGVIEATGHYGNAVDLGLSAMVRNAGTIVETHGGDAVLLAAGSCDNAAGATIAGGIGVEANGGPASTVTNAGLITGTYAGLYLHAGGTVSNSAGGTITGGYGVLVAGTGRVQNAAGAAILGYAAGIEVKAGAGTVLNYGLVTTARGFDVAVLNGGTVLDAGSLAGRGGIELAGGGQVTNAASGRITTRRFGIEIQGPGGTVQNAGTVVVSGEYGKGVVLAIGDALTNAGLIEASGVYGAGVAVSGASSLQNAAAGTILATGSAGVAVSCTAPATIVNAGRIEESGSGIGLLAASGLVENETRGLIEGGIGVEFRNAAYATLINDGVISGSLIGIEVRGVSAVTIDNSGTIASASGAAGVAVDFKAGNDVLQLSPSSVLVGLVEGGIGTSRVRVAGWHRGRDAQRNRHPVRRSHPDPGRTRARTGCCREPIPWHPAPIWWI